MRFGGTMEHTQQRRYAPGTISSCSHHRGVNGNGNDSIPLVDRPVHDHVETEKSSPGHVYARPTLD